MLLITSRMTACIERQIKVVTKRRKLAESFQSRMLSNFSRAVHIIMHELR